MSRTVAALYDSRAEAELARNRLMSGVKAKSPRIIARDTVGAVDGLNIDPKAKVKLRDAVTDGSSLLVAELPAGTKPNHVVDLLDVAVTNTRAEWPPAQLPNQPVADGQPAFEVAEEREAAPRISARRSTDGQLAAAVQPRRQHAPEPPQQRDPAQAAAETTREAPPRPTLAERLSQAPPAKARAERLSQAPPAPARAERVSEAPPQSRPEAVIEEVRIPKVTEELRVGKREVSRGGARVRSFMRDCPAEEQVTLREEVVEVENRSSGRRVTDSELNAGGLFKERIVDIAEMREEPVVTKTAVVREEVIIRKTVKERVETIHDTVRRTQIEFEDLPAAESKGSAPRFFNRG